VQVRSGDPAGSTHIAHDLPRLHQIAGLYQELRLMQESAEDSPTVVDVGRIAAYRQETCEGNPPSRRG
jgi:hypothetical protein